MTLKNFMERIGQGKRDERPNKATSSHETGLDIQNEFEKAGKVLKVWSEVLKEHVYFVSSEAATKCVTTDAVAYTAQELQAMLDMIPEEVRATHEVKKVFYKARVINHTKEV